MCTIVSFSVRVGHAGSDTGLRSLSLDESKVLHQMMTLSQPGSETAALLGQPVKLSEGSGAVVVLRIALGADMVVSALNVSAVSSPLFSLEEAVQQVLLEDQLVVDKLVFLCQNWHQLTAAPAPRVTEVPNADRLQLLSTSGVGSVASESDKQNVCSRMNRIDAAFGGWSAGGHVSGTGVTTAVDLSTAVTHLIQQTGGDFPNGTHS